MNTVITKLSSRKFISAIVGMVMGLAMVFGLDEETISTVAGAVVSLVSVVAYIYTEGKVDAVALTSSVAYLFEDSIDISDVTED